MRNNHDTAFFCPACLERGRKVAPEYQQRFILGYLENGKCNRCTYDENQKSEKKDIEQ